VARYRSGDRIGDKLRVVRELGHGGMGVVYEVEHLHTGHRRAVKVLRRERMHDPRAAARLLREASVAGRVNSPRLVDTLDVDQLDDGSPYILMELLEGETLAARLARRGALEVGEVLRLAEQIAEGLVAAHDAGVLHRDLSPKNVFLVRDARGEQVKLVDFGLSRMVAGMTDRFGHLTETGALIGTPHYVSPEQTGGGEIGPATDQYAFAVVLYECLCGRRPYEGDSLISVIGRIATGDHPPLAERRPDLPLAMTEAIARAMRVRPGERFADIESFMQALRGPARDTQRVPELGYADTAPVRVEARPRPTPARRASPAPRRSTPRRAPEPAPTGGLGRGALLGVGLGAAIVVGAGIGVGAFLYSRRPAAAEPTVPAPSPQVPVASGVENEAAVRELRMYLEHHDYAACIDRSDEVPRTPRVLELALECARAANEMDDAGRACRELNEIAPRRRIARRCRAVFAEYGRPID